MTPCEILFIHQNMPGQFRFLAAAFAQLPQFSITFLTRREGVELKGVRTVRYPSPDETRATNEPLLAPVEKVVRFGRAVLAAALELRRDGYVPDLIIVHPGWGEGLFLRDVWPQTKIITYGEYYYQPDGGDIGFDPLFPVTFENLARTRMMNTHLLLGHAQADAILSPTEWQRSRHPDFLQSRITTIFDGIDTTRIGPAPEARYTLPDGRVLTRADEVITFVSRNLEPHRGFHVLIRALPDLLARRPDAQVVIVGGTDVSYSPNPPPPHNSWKDCLLSLHPIGEGADRVHFVGKQAYGDYLALLQVSAAHLYLTFPFVLSWSCLEAMAAGCLVIASDTAPVREVIDHGRNGLLFPFHDHGALVETVSGALDDPEQGAALRAAARATVVERYDLRLCLAHQVQLIQRVLYGTGAVTAPA
ncbi:glycosyltransferase [Novosphingobium piscinae]|uniref:Glycosyltransferase n=1 Tax=Novosphingobium piscinae TaxID=1507448 RepID=A0A7X1FX57_9SPHN|nr:glycosyltransferase [Novosphingobium piscinae]MBC2667987.1 glycosyltransferase [Novosphingobium piscinae]